jgi:nucleoside-diphosphate-sugar epimerase
MTVSHPSQPLLITKTNGPAPLAAVTGASGFIGQHLVRLLISRGWSVRLLLRSEPSIGEWRSRGAQVVAGSLAEASALERLVEGAEVVIHVAGLIKAANRGEFFKSNRDGTQALAEVVQRVAPTANFLHVSSLAAREPQLSDYAASKRAGEEAARTILGDRVTVLRPPAVYGPGDRETLVFFQLARQRLVPLLGSASARAAMIHVDDLVRLIERLATLPPCGQVLTAADARPEGYRWHEVLGAAARAVGNERARLVHAPQALLRAVALVGDAGRRLGAANMLNSQKLRELQHEDWSVSAGELASAPDWAPQYDLDTGFADAVTWYRTIGWL